METSSPQGENSANVKSTHSLARRLITRQMISVEGGSVFSRRRILRPLLAGRFSGVVQRLHRLQS